MALTPKRQTMEEICDILHAEAVSEGMGLDREMFSKRHMRMSHAVLLKCLANMKLVRSSLPFGAPQDAGEPLPPRPDEHLFTQFSTVLTRTRFVQWAEFVRYADTVEALLRQRDAEVKRLREERQNAQNEMEIALAEAAISRASLATSKADTRAECLQAVRSERLEGHDEYLKSGVGEDEAYSRGNYDAEQAILATGKGK